MSLLVGGMNFPPRVRAEDYAPVWGASRASWGFRAGFQTMMEKPVLRVDAPFTTVAPGGLSFASQGTSSWRLETRSSGLGVAVELPRGERLGWDVSFGAGDFNTSVPSGSVTNDIPGQAGFWTGVGVSIDLVPLTPVTPRVHARFSWNLSRSQAQQIYYGSDNRWDGFGGRMEIRTTALSVGVEPSWWRGLLRPVGGFQIFSKSSRLAAASENFDLSGRTQGYRLWAGFEARVFEAEAAGLEFSAGDEKGLKVYWRQRFR